MYYGFTDDELDLTSNLGTMLTPAVATLSESAAGDEASELDSRLWQELTQGGWVAAFSLTDGAISRPAMVALGEELGRAGARVPWTNVFGFVLPLLERLPGEVASSLLSALNEGQMVTSPAATVSPGAVVVSRQGSTDVRVTGTIPFVPFAPEAHGILTLATDRDGDLSLVCVDPRVDGVQSRDIQSADLLKRYFDVELDEAPAILVSQDSEDLHASLRIAEHQYSLLLSAEAIGGLDGLLTRAIEYVCEREQFGVPIGSFQAIKHILANVSTSVHSGKAMTYLAASGLDRGTLEGTRDVECARMYTSDSYLHGAEAVIQSHGGFGFTWEANLHLWYRNAMANFHLPDRRKSLAALAY